MGVEHANSAGVRTLRLWLSTQTNGFCSGLAKGLVASACKIYEQARLALAETGLMLQPLREGSL
jgi:hypothetical protein